MARAIAGATSVPQLTAPGGGILAVAYQNQQTGARAHTLLAISIDARATWTYTESHVDGDADQASSRRSSRRSVPASPPR